MDNSKVVDPTLGCEKSKSKRAMLDIIIALIPAAIASIVFFGFKAAIMIAVCVGMAVISEYVFNILCKRPHTTGDLSAIVTGLLLALSLSTNATVWQCMVGSVFAIVIVKCAFGGLGRNFANPAVAAKVMLLIAFANISVTAAKSYMPSVVELMINNPNGAIGEACAVALIVGGIYLLIRRVISWQIPVVYIAGVFILSLVLTKDINSAIYHVLSGGLIIGAVFMATDPVTSPKKGLGKIVFALGCAILTVLIRFYGTYTDGTSFAILLMNIICPYIDRMFEKNHKNEEAAQ